MPENDSGKQELLQLPPEGELAPIEHLFFGSTCTIKGAIIDVLALIPEARRGNIEAKRQLLTPAFLQYNSSIEARNLVESKRQVSRETIERVGFILVLANEGVFAADKEGLSLFLEYSRLDESGFVLPVWKFNLVDRARNIVNKPLILVNQQIASDSLPEFSLGEIRVEQRKGLPVFYRTIHLNLGS